MDSLEAIEAVVQFGNHTRVYGFSALIWHTVLVHFFSSLKNHPQTKRPVFFVSVTKNFRQGNANSLAIVSAFVFQLSFFLSCVMAKCGTILIEIKVSSKAVLTFVHRPTNP
jgi:hypothetical protein